ncbi:YARHG domain-containing protein [Tumidithrix elongata RA019]|uniref:non-specific serine/threonine protein kinase n=1 Tax=Tumidithrix elongata BACA0141 TaxID=2716417 RepID=A0AAW9PV94_9CYAN|nr:YARHG domain-containing protein [Tumidithrix elongata RA019]
MLGKVIGGRYKIVSHLGSGGFGETYVAEDLQLPDRARCVVKRLKPESKDSFILQTARRLFETEAKVLHRLGKHNQIPQLLAHFEENREFYLVQELIDGQDLAQELGVSRSSSGVARNAIKTEAQVLDFLEDVLQILEFVHQQDVIHRDIKPANLLRRKSDGKLVLIDFGAVKQIYTQLSSQNPQAEPTNMTVAVGTVGYMPNEQANGKPRLCSDIYAVGMIAIQSLIGIPPSQLPEDPATSEIAWRQSPPNAKITYRAEVSPELANVLDKMIRYDFRQRYQSASEALVDVRKLRSHLASTMIASNEPRQGSSPSQALTQSVNQLPPPPLPNSNAVAPLAFTDVVAPTVREAPTKPQRSGGAFWAGVGLFALVVSVGVAAIAISRFSSKPTPQPLASTEIKVEPSKTPTTSTSTPTPTATVSNTPSPTPKNGSIPTSPTPKYAFLSERPVTDADLKGKSMDELDIMRNEVYARYGRRFRDLELQAFFDAQPWYKPRYSPEDFPHNILTSLEKQNVKEIVEFQQRSQQGQLPVVPTTCASPKRVIEDLDPPINVRKGPGITFPVVGKLNNGVEISVTTEKNGWFQISAPLNGWVAANRTALICPK